LARPPESPESTPPFERRVLKGPAARSQGRNNPTSFANRLGVTGAAWRFAYLRL